MLQKAKDTPPPLSQVIMWLGLRFDTISMTVAFQHAKLEEVMTLVGYWCHRTTSIYDLRTTLGKLFYMAQCCPPARYFMTRMLDTLRWCPLQGLITLSAEFKKDLP